MMELFDSHCHVNEERFDEDREQVLLRMREAGVTRFAVIGSDIATSRAAAAFAAGHEGCWAAVGIHPHEAKHYREGDLEILTGLLREEKVPAIGEIGLDYHYDLSPRQTQQEVCALQMALARELKVPVVYHVREAHPDMLAMMKERRQQLTGGIIHCFSGSWEIAREYLELGYYISFAGPVTFKKAPKLQEAVRKMPADRLLIETDSPYLAPEPVRGHRNEPANVRHVCLKIAELRGESPEEVAARTTANALRAYGLAQAD